MEKTEEADMNEIGNAWKKIARESLLGNVFEWKPLWGEGTKSVQMSRKASTERTASAKALR